MPNALRKQTLARQDAYLLSDAKRFGHHGLANFIETVRQRHNMHLTREYACELLSRAGYPQREGV